VSTQYDPSTGTFIDDGVNDTPPDYTEPLKASLNGGTQPPPLDTGYAAPLQKALAATQAPQNPQSPGGQDGLALPSVDVDKIANQLDPTARLAQLEAKPPPAVQTPAVTASPPIPGAPSNGVSANAPATATHHTILSPESQQAITQLDTATANESAAQKALGETRAQVADVNAEGARARAVAEQQRQDRIKDRLAKAQADYDARVKEYDRQYTALKGMHETDFYADKSTGYKIASAISIALGAVSQAFGGKNIGAELIEKEIERHSARQRAEIVNQRELTEKAHVGVEGAKNEADRQQTLWETAALDRAAADVQSRASQFGGQEERQKAAVIAAQLEAKSAEKKALLLKMTGEQVVTDTGRQTEAERLKLAAEQAKNNAKAKAKGTAGGGGHSGNALADILAGQPPAEVQKKYRLSDKDLGKVLANAKNAPGAAPTEDNPLAVRDAAGNVRGLASSSRVVKQTQDRVVQYDQAVESLEQLLAARKASKLPSIGVGDPAYDKAVLAIASVTQANASDKTTAHEAGTLKRYGLINEVAIENILADIKHRRAAFLNQLRPVTAGPVEHPYAGAARAAKEQQGGSTAAPKSTPAPEALPPGLPPGAKSAGYTKDGRRAFRLPNGGLVATDAL
jgi:hypothetical protein